MALRATARRWAPSAATYERRRYEGRSIRATAGCSPTSRVWVYLHSSTPRSRRPLASTSSRSRGAPAAPHDQRAPTRTRRSAPPYSGHPHLPPARRAISASSPRSSWIANDAWAKRRYMIPAVSTTLANRCHDAHAPAPPDRPHSRSDLHTFLHFIHSSHKGRLLRSQGMRISFRAYSFVLTDPA